MSVGVGLLVFKGLGFRKVSRILVRRWLEWVVFVNVEGFSDFVGVSGKEYIVEINRCYNIAAMFGIIS